MIERIGFAGAGQMGHGIAHFAALAGCEVRLADVSAEQLEKAVVRIGHNLDRQLRRGVIDEFRKAKTLDQIRTTTSLADLGDCDLVIEAATEKEAVKREIFKSLIPHLRDDALLATNTSSISITRLAAATDRPTQFMGMHFMNPVPVMLLVELIRGIATDTPTFKEIGR